MLPPLRNHHFLHPPTPFYLWPLLRPWVHFMIRCWPYTSLASMKEPVQHCSYDLKLWDGAEGFNLSLRPGAKPTGSLIRTFAQEASQGTTRSMPTQRQTKKKSPSDLRRDRQRRWQKSGASINAPGSPEASVNAPMSPGASVNAPTPGAGVNAPMSQGASVNGPGSTGASVNSPKAKFYAPGPPGASVYAPNLQRASDSAPRPPGASNNAPGSPGASVYTPGLKPQGVRQKARGARQLTQGTGHPGATSRTPTQCKEPDTWRKELDYRAAQGVGPPRQGARPPTQYRVYS